ncbi:helix-turn-helix domain-containing protein [Paramagnetospirillum magneticum]|nr:helix-turn-helix domain-containing protein [Paramagnetospirillum magneticum]
MKTETTTPILVAPKYACLLLGVGNTHLYKLINQKKLDVVKIGKSTRITMESIRVLAGVQ